MGVSTLFLTVLTVILPLLAPNREAAFVAVINRPKLRCRLEFSDPPQFTLTIEAPRKQVYSTDAKLVKAKYLYKFVRRRTVDMPKLKCLYYEFAAVGSADTITISAYITAMSRANLTFLDVDRVPFCTVELMVSGSYTVIPLNREGAPASKVFRRSGPVPFKRRGTWGYKDPASGKVLIEPRFDSANRFWSKRALVRVGGKSGFIDLTGAFVVKPRFGECKDFGSCSEPGLAIVTLGGKKGMIGLDGRIVIPTKFDGFESPFTDGVIGTKLGGLVGLVDRTGRVIAKPRFRMIGICGEGLIAVRSNAGWGYLTKKGALVIPHRYDSGGTFVHGLAPVLLRSGKWGYIDPKGKMKIEARFDNASEFSSKLAKVGLIKTDSRTGRSVAKFGFINLQGKVVIPIKYDETKRFYGGNRCEARIGDRKGWLYRDGRFEQR